MCVSDLGTNTPHYRAWNGGKIFVESESYSAIKNQTKNERKKNRKHIPVLALKKVKTNRLDARELPSSSSLFLDLLLLRKDLMNLQYFI